MTSVVIAAIISGIVFFILGGLFAAAYEKEEARKREKALVIEHDKRKSRLIVQHTAELRLAVAKEAEMEALRCSEILAQRAKAFGVKTRAIKKQLGALRGEEPEMPEEPTDERE